MPVSDTIVSDAPILNNSIWIMRPALIRRAALKLLHWLAAQLEYDLIPKPSPDDRIPSDTPIWRFEGFIQFGLFSGQGNIPLVIDIKESNVRKAQTLAQEQAQMSYADGHFFTSKRYRIDKPIPKTRSIKKIAGEGYVYLIQASTGHYKIGLTIDPQTRIGQLGVKLPFELQILHLIHTNDMRRAEVELHGAYAHRRVRGEWFELSDSDVVVIKAIKELIYGVQS